MISRRKVLIGGGAFTLAGVGTAALGVSRASAMKEYDAAVAATRAMLKASPDAVDLLRYATLAASGHNTQPWRFRLAPQRISILPDFTRRTPVVDPDDHHLFVSLGCAAENLRIASHARSLTGDLRFIPAGEGAVEFAYHKGPVTESALCDAIPKRQSTRAEYDGKGVSAADLGRLNNAASLAGVDLVLISDRAQINRIRDLVIAANTAQMADRAFVRELKTWLRFDPHDALARGDGLFSAASGLPTLPTWLGPRLFDWAFTVDSENDKYARQLDTAAAVAVFVGHESDREHWFTVGRACQRFALQATALGLKHSFVNQPVEVAAFRSELAALIGLPGRRPDLVVRFGHGPALPYSARRPVESTILA